MAYHIIANTPYFFIIKEGNAMVLNELTIIIHEYIFFVSQLLWDLTRNPKLYSSFYAGPVKDWFSDPLN